MKKIITILGLSFLGYGLIWGCSGSSDTGSSSSTDNTTTQNSPATGANGGTSAGIADAGVAASGDAQVAKTGSLTCAQVEACLEKCTDDACADDCYNQGTSDAQKQLAALYECFYKPNDACDKAADTCLQTTCSAQGNACKNDKSAGNNCAQILQCMNNCAADAEECPSKCYENGSATGKSLLDAYDKCFSDSCSPAYNSCYEQGCATEMKACGL